MQKQDVGVLCEKYERLVYTICYQFTKNHSTAEDLTQETFISAFSHIDTCPKGAEKPWLARIATNKAKDYLKSA
ncbi:MAG: RNA polymerase sigma factor, partial [Oscillospiraceae bacterium]